MEARRLFSFFVTTAGNELALTPNENNASFAIIVHNVRTYRSGGVMAVVRGKNNAEERLRKFQDAQSSSEQHEGWRYFIEPTSLTPGTDPAEATKQRQAELELRESKASDDAPRPTGSET